MGCGAGVTKIRFYLVDVFASRPLSGNSLAVVPQADDLDDAAMQDVARELKQAETTFLLSPTRQSADWRLRSFTPTGTEVFGAGHNSLGAWWWLAESGVLRLDERTTFTQEIGDRLLPVEIESSPCGVEGIALTQSAPAFGRLHSDLQALTGALGLSTDHLDASAFPPQTVDTGAAHLLVPVRDRAAVDCAEPDGPRLKAALRTAGAEGCYLFTREAVESSSAAYARFFNPTAGIVEDSATGTAAGPLACQLIRHGFVEDGSRVNIEQGHRMGRPSLLSIQVRGDEVKLSGQCVLTAGGMLRVR